MKYIVFGSTQNCGLIMRSRILGIWLTYLPVYMTLDFRTVDSPLILVLICYFLVSHTWWLSCPHWRPFYACESFGVWISSIVLNSGSHRSIIPLHLPGRLTIYANFALIWQFLYAIFAYVHTHASLPFIPHISLTVSAHLASYTPDLRLSSLSSHEHM